MGLWLGNGFQLVCTVQAFSSGVMNEKSMHPPFFSVEGGTVVTNNLCIHLICACNQLKKKGHKDI